MSKSRCVFVLLAMLSTSGCEIMGEASNLMDKGGSGAFSCGQIEAAFAAYDADRESAGAYEELARVTGMGSTDVVTRTSDAYHAKAVERANIALLIQGCEPMQ